MPVFHAHGVRYLIVGGYAVIFDAQPRFTKDIDLCAALASFGAPLEGIRAEEFADRGRFFRFGRDPRASIFSLTFRELILTPPGT